MGSIHSDVMRGHGFRPGLTPVKRNSIKDTVPRDELTKTPQGEDEEWGQLRPGSFCFPSPLSRALQMVRCGERVDAIHTTLCILKERLSLMSNEISLNSCTESNLIF